MQHVLVEPIQLMFAIGIGFIPIVMNQLYFEKVCITGTNLFGNGTFYPKEICSNVNNGSFPEINVSKISRLWRHYVKLEKDKILNWKISQDYVQKQVARMNSASYFLQYIPVIFYVLVLGPWSDKYGRKFLIIFPLLGFILLNSIFLMHSIFFEVLALIMIPKNLGTLLYTVYLFHRKLALTFSCWNAFKIWLVYTYWTKISLFTR